jgi:mannose-6-phosphate isomerase-like protein (cupin superfamily)
MDWQTWVRQSLPRTDYMRGGATVWAPGAAGLLGDALGPRLHLHNDASEIFYFRGGRCRMEVGDSEEIFEAGDFVLVPPEVPHNLWSASPDENLLVFWLVAPHFQANKWQTENFPPGARQGRVIRSRVEVGATLPSDAQINSALLTLPAGAEQTGRTGETQEAVLYVVQGSGQAQVGPLSGPLGADQFVHVPVDTVYGFSATVAAQVILFTMPR